VSEVSRSPRVIVIAMEVGDGKLIRQWADQGELPVLKRLADEGSWGWLESPAEYLHVSAWPTLYTGTSAGRHGVYYTFQPAPGIQGHRRFAPGQYGMPTLWKVLSDAGKRCTVFDAPYTYPEDGFSGSQVCDWGAWAQYLGPTSTPPALIKELTNACGRYPLGLEAHDIGLVHLDAQEMKERLIGAIHAKTDATCWLMDREPWDFFLMVYGETHPAAHYCLQLSGQADGQSIDAHDQVLLRSVYQALDQGIGKILERIDEETTVFVVSGDGLGPNHSGWHLLPEVLERLGYFATAGQKQPAAAEEASQDSGAKKDLVKMVRDLLPVGFRKALARRLPTGLRDALAKRVDMADIDWSRTQAFCLPTDLEGYIRINLRGREPEGIVEPGEEYEAVCQAMTAALTGLINPATGQPAVKQVIRVDDMFPGDRRAYLPDLIVVWTGDTVISALESAAIGQVKGKSPDGRVGTHASPGFVIGRGPAIRRGGTLAGGHILDLAPTVLSRFGVASDQMEGRVWDLS